MNKITSEQLRRAARAVNVQVVFANNTVSIADMTGYSGAVANVRGWWGRRRGKGGLLFGDLRFLGKDATEAYSALPDDPGGPWGAPERLPF
jgi:hypothetical protein